MDASVASTSVGKNSGMRYSASWAALLKRWETRERSAGWLEGCKGKGGHVRSGGFGVLEVRQKDGIFQWGAGDAESGAGEVSPGELGGAGELSDAQ
jgi:hypothetical protein